MSGEDIRVSGTFKRGLKVGETVHKEFVLRAPTASDYFEAEVDCPDSTRFITFRTSLAVRQLVRIGSFEGPFTLSMLGKLHPGDLRLLLDKRDEAENLGEGEQPA
ncbi:hypothetical protein ACTJI2_13740 [Pseudoxanthomonas sp. 22568]|jgi:phage FluMu protein gp41|uniref:hypothetical protein n=1 Tax=Pseudoxanthomonas sp. 22568 TaxID=3453945 RepID=UPI003F837BF2